MTWGAKAPFFVVLFGGKFHSVARTCSGLAFSSVPVVVRRSSDDHNQSQSHLMWRCGYCGQHPTDFKQRESASIERLLLLGRGLSLCPYEPEHRIVKTATKPMNALALIRKQLARKEALQTAQKTNAQTLCYRGQCYIKQG